jgi:hypothetical protein
VLKLAGHFSGAGIGQAASSGDLPPRPAEADRVAPVPVAGGLAHLVEDAMRTGVASAISTIVPG